MTARPEDQPLPLDEGREEMAAKPRRGQAEDGKTGGRSQGGRAAGDQFGTPGGAGTNAQRAGPSGTESEREAPGMSTDKKPDDTK